MQSVFSQLHQDYELIVIDGASTDGSVNLIKKSADRINYWITEPDCGIYQAHNKGLAVARGEYLLFLNSGDALNNVDVLSNVLPFLQNTDIVYGDLVIKEDKRDWIKKYNEPVIFSYFLEDTLPHQGSFIKRSIFEKTGPYDESLKIAGDWKFFIEAVCRYNASIRYLDFVVADYDFTGISSNKENEDKTRKEKRSILGNSFPRFVRDYDELLNLRGKYPLLANSRAVKTYFKIRNLFTKSAH